ncbi:small ribosomal subunit protein uS9m isoform X2 [Drosophila sulfurigaster albostrigata]|uniref:small ribosomal subunit protein uS9m isoform X2 n=1 Tax=Drosophila sulfurigaster albostrigata TaxID=89887 RepID=UPI002D21E802|nr:small ribosomal subunit protein uS9m isoform X2 [Drosophila sulfurigaster albostrigata]
MALRVFGLNLIKTNRNLLQNAAKINGVNNAQAVAGASYATQVTVEATPAAVQKQKVSKAMKAYLKRASEHDEFMKTQQLDFQIGKRHLANMMGADAETFTQEDIDQAIAYLFPSGLYDKRARPAMRSPDEVFPARKAAEFDETGRPFHSMFYTGKPNFFQLLHDIVAETNKLNDLEERMLRRGNKPDDNQRLETAGFQLLPKEQLERLLVEQIADIEYQNFCSSMDRLIASPYAYKSKAFIERFLKPLMDQSKQLEVPKPKIDEQGRQYVTTYECLRKTARADVTVRLPGTGKITINGQDISYFSMEQSKEQVSDYFSPLNFSDMLGKVDVEANVEGGGPSGQAGAIRWGIAMSLRSFVDQEMIESMRLAGLLTRDYRRRERKKFGQEGARRKYTWKKR